MRTTYRYHLKAGRRIIHRGVSNDLSRREKEHQATYPGSRIRQIGRRTTRRAALEWERAGGKGCPSP